MVHQISLSPQVKLKKNFMAQFYGWGSTASRLVPLQGGSLPFTTKFPDIPTYKHGIHKLPHKLPKDLRFRILGN